MTGIAAEQSQETPGRYGAPLIPVGPLASTLSAPGLRSRPWARISLRWQILAAFIFSMFVAGIVAAVVIVYDARRAAQVEIASSMRLAQSFVRDAVARAPADGTGATVLESLARELAELRHVRVLVTGIGGGMIPMLPLDDEIAPDTTRKVPAWFTELVRVEDVRREMRIGLGNRRIGSVILIGHAGDEIAEVWEDSKKLASVALALNIAVAAILYFALGRVLHPLTSLGRGLQELEKGQFQHRLSPPGVPELADIAARFNALAGRLSAARADNGRLTRRLVTVQDDERRHIANELHDEIGPCLFGLKANIASLEQFAGELSPASAEKMRERVRTLADISDTIQMLNRRLLNRVRPMALGHVPLTDLVSGLVADFERIDRHPHISLSVAPIAHSYGDSIDLTIYRCLQEGITNAKRHSGAGSIAIELKELPAEKSPSDDGAAASSVLRLSVQDDGRGFAPGMPWGFGLSGMDERVRALGGTLNIVEPPEKGTRLEIIIPLDDNRRQAAGDRRSRKRSGNP
jgi:Signal transduction histidine kinase